MITYTKTSLKPFVVATWYRPPDSPTAGDLYAFKPVDGRLDSQNVDLYLIGDLNNLASSSFDTNTNLLTSIADVRSR